MVKGINEFYLRYKKMSPKPMSRELFKEILVKFNTQIMDCVLEGSLIEMGHGLSSLCIIRMEADPKKMLVDWKASLKLKEELLAEGAQLFDSVSGTGENWLVYRHQDTFFKFYWKKKDVRLKNRTGYRFDATRGAKGNKTKLKALLRSDDLAYLRFRRLWPRTVKYLEQ